MTNDDTTRIDEIKARLAAENGCPVCGGTGTRASTAIYQHGAPVGVACMACWDARNATRRHAPADLAFLLAQVERKDALLSEYAETSRGMCERRDLAASALLARAEKAERERDEARRQRDEMESRASLFGQLVKDIFYTLNHKLTRRPDRDYMKMARTVRDQIDDRRREIPAIERAEAAERERDDARAERDHWRATAEARPAITREDANAFYLYTIGSHDQSWKKTVAGYERAKAALRAHAKVGGS